RKAAPVESRNVASHRSMTSSWRRSPLTRAVTSGNWPRSARSRSPLTVTVVVVGDVAISLIALLQPARPPDRAATALVLSEDEPRAPGRQVHPEPPGPIGIA